MIKDKKNKSIETILNNINFQNKYSSRIKKIVKYKIK